MVEKFGFFPNVSTFRSLFPIFRLLNKKAKLKVFQTCTLVILSSFLDLFLIVLLVQLVEPLLDGSVNLNNIIEYKIENFNILTYQIQAQPTISELAFFSIGFSLFYIFVRIKIFEEITKTSIVIAPDLAKKGLRNYLKYPYFFDKDLKNTTIPSLLLGDIERIVTQCFLPLFLLLQAFMLIMASILPVFFEDALATLLIFGCMILIYIVIGKLNNKPNKSLSKAFSSYRSQSLTLINSISENSNTLHTLENKDEIIGNYIKLFQNSLTSQLNINVRSTIPKFILEGSMVIITAILILNSSRISSPLTFLAAFVVAIQRILPSVQQVYRSYITLVASSTQLSNLIKILNKDYLAYGLIRFPRKIKNSVSKSSDDFYINLQNTFTGYSLIIDTSSNSFKSDKFRFTISSPSGLGKTSLLLGLTNFLPNFKGEIIIPNKYYNNTLFLYLSRSSTLLPLSVITNIFPHKAQNQISNKEYNKANNLIHRLNIPVSLDSNFDNIEVLSSGQKARLLLTRAIIIKPTILIIDELIDSLDERNEILVYEILREFLPNTLIINVTHKSLKNYHPNHTKLIKS